MKHKNNCHVYRDANRVDCTNGGVTFIFDAVIVVTGVPYRTIEHDGKTYLDRPDEDAVMRYVKEQGLDEKKVLLLCDRFDNPVYTPYLKPLDAVYGKAPDGERLAGPMYGGNFVEIDYTTAVRVHDRYETQYECDTLSR